MAKLSGLIGSGKVGKADQKVVDAMPDAPTSTVLESSISKELASPEPMPESGVGRKTGMLESSAPEAAVSNLSISQICHSPFQVRAIADTDYIETLMASIVQSGVISPIIVRMLESSAYEVIAGHHRLEACRRLGYITVPVVVRQMTDAEAACALASDNFVRKELSDFERYKHAKLLKDLGFCKTNSEVGQVLGVSRQLVGFLFAFEDYPDSAKSILELNPNILGATQANELKDIAKKEPDLFAEAITLLAKDKLKQNQIKPWIESKFRTATVRMQRRREVKITKPGLSSAIKMIYTDNEAKICADGLNVLKLQKLIEDNLESLITN